MKNVLWNTWKVPVYMMGILVAGGAELHRGEKKPSKYPQLPSTCPVESLPCHRTQPWDQRRRPTCITTISSIAPVIHTHIIPVRDACRVGQGDAGERRACSLCLSSSEMGTQPHWSRNSGPVLGTCSGTSGSFEDYIPFSLDSHSVAVRLTGKQRMKMSK